MSSDLIDRSRLLPDYLLGSALMKLKKKPMQQKMRALVKDCGKVAVRSLPRPEIGCDDQVLIRVELAGLCRTDMYVAEGRIAGRDPLILGHEFSGVVESAGDYCDRLQVGDKVTVNPLFSCGACSICLAGQCSDCQHSQFLGIDCDGCFAGYAVVPYSSVLSLPPGLDAEHGAYAEPVAASLAVLKSGIRPDEKGLLLGSNRFSQLMQKILKIKSFTNVVTSATGEELPSHYFDYVIETSISTKTIETMIRVVRPGGKLVLKSRSHEPVELKVHEAVKKEPQLHFVNYGSFEEALDLMASGNLHISDLVDGVYKLDDFQAVLDVSKRSESLKPFFAPWMN